MHPIRRRLRSAALGVRAVGAGALLACVCACASVDFDHPKTESYAPLDTEDTALGRAIDDLAHAEPGESGFYLLADGIDALAARVLMVEEAERTIDVQSYLIHDGISSRLIIEELLQAADRGVRVRLLLDDFLTLGLDDGLRAFDAHPNVEVRLFNPFAHRRWRFLDVFSFTRINRRMHNKSFTVDNQATIIGGRNISDEYFGARDDLNFGDLDVFGVGDVVREVSAMFDEYWNCGRSLPMGALFDELEDPDAAVATLRETLRTSVADAANTPYGEVLVSTIFETLQEEAYLTWCTYELVYDSPDKAYADRAKDADTIVSPLVEAIEAAEERVVIVSPYFVPLRRARRWFADQVERGVETVVITNSLAANNHSTVHAGYAPTRRHLLENGVQLWEVRGDTPVPGLERVGKEESRATLHTKAFVIDRERMFIGSFNFDPRSVDINTEMGIILDAPDIAREVSEQVFAVLPVEAYRVTVDEHHRLFWTTIDNGQEVVFTREPDTSWWRRFTTGLMEILPMRSQL